MRDHLRRRPRLEELESMTLLSGVSAVMPAAAAAVTPITPMSHELNLTGSVHGNYHTREIPDAGKTYTFFGHGSVSPLGRTSMSGNVQLPGLIISPVIPGTTPPVMAPNAHGQVFLSDARGSLTLTLTAPSSDNSSTLPPFFKYTITNASGRFRGDTGSGYLVIDVTPKVTPTPTAGATLGQEHGSFTLSFIPPPPSTTTG